MKKTIGFSAMILSVMVMLSPVMAQAQGDGIIKVSQFYTVGSLEDRTIIDDILDLFSPTEFGIQTDRTEYNVGEMVYAEGFLHLNADCQEGLSTEVKLLSSTGSNQATFSHNFGPAGFQTLLWEFQISTQSLNPGTYNLEARWYCQANGFLFTLDGGEIDIFNGDHPEILTFSVVEGGSGGGSVCSVTCDPGYEKVEDPFNPEDCFCQPAWTENNGICEVGEPQGSSDCQQTTCPPGQTPVGGQCISERCADGTLPGQCSINKPGYCQASDLNLVANPLFCGCPFGEVLENGVCTENVDETMIYVVIALVGMMAVIGAVLIIKK